MKYILCFFLCLGVFFSIGQDSLFTSADKPASTADNSPLTLGLVFRSKVDGLVTDFRFYKPSATDEGNAVIGIYTADGVLLHAQEYSLTGAAGWRRIRLNQSVRVDAGANYIAAIYLPTGRFGYRDNMFTADRTRGNLTAPANARSGGNNRYEWGNALIFPKSARNRSYYIDVVFYPRAPLIVNAGPDTSYAMPRDTFRLSGQATGDSVWYSWNIVDSLTYPWYEGMVLRMHNSQTLSPYITGFSEGVYTLSLTAWDMWGESSSNNVKISITADPKEVIFELLRDGTWRVKDGKKYFLMKTDAGQ